MKTFKLPIKYLLDRKIYLIAGLFALFAVDLIQLFIPKVVQFIIDDLSKFNIDMQKITKYLLIVVCLSLAVAFFRFWWRYCIIGTAYKIEQRLRKKIFSHLMSLDQKFYNTHTVGDLMAHLTNDLNAVRMVFGMGFIAFFDGFGLSILAIMFMININFDLTLFALIPLPIFVSIVLVIGKKLHDKFGNVQASFSDLTSKTQESFAGIRVVKGFNIEDYNLKEFKIFANDLVLKNISLVKIWGLLGPLMGLIIGISLAIIIYFGGELAILGDISIGQFVAFNTYLGILAWPMMAIGWFMNLYQKSKASMERINKLLEIEPEIKEAENPQEIDTKTASLEIKNLSFAYDEKKVLKNINMTIKPNQKVAIVGKTGCGKTTLIKLIMRVYDNYEGEIKLNNYNIKEIKISNFKETISLVSQETFLFSKSISANVAFDEEAGLKIPEKIEKYTKYAQIYDDINSFPEGFETKLGEKGVNLSGGQKQRISIARALYKDAPLLILDDSLSAVDTNTENNILKVLYEKINFKTVIMISHRISSIKNCDQIFVMDEGEIKETGTHQELLEKNGLYHNLHEKQKIQDSLTNQNTEAMEQ